MVGEAEHPLLLLQGTASVPAAIVAWPLLFVLGMAALQAVSSSLCGWHWAMLVVLGHAGGNGTGGFQSHGLCPGAPHPAESSQISSCKRPQHISRPQHEVHSNVSPLLQPFGDNPAQAHCLAAGDSQCIAPRHTGAML